MSTYRSWASSNYGQKLTVNFARLRTMQPSLGASYVKTPYGIVNKNLRQIVSPGIDPDYAQQGIITLNASICADEATKRKCLATAGSPLVAPHSTNREDFAVSKGEPCAYFLGYNSFNSRVDGQSPVEAFTCVNGLPLLECQKPYGVAVMESTISPTIQNLSVTLLTAGTRSVRHTGIEPIKQGDAVYVDLVPDIIKPSDATSEVAPALLLKASHGGRFNVALRPLRYNDAHKLLKHLQESCMARMSTEPIKIRIAGVSNPVMYQSIFEDVAQSVCKDNIIGPLVPVHDILPLWLAYRWMQMIQIKEFIPQNGTEPVLAMYTHLLFATSAYRRIAEDLERARTVRINTFVSAIPHKLFDSKTSPANLVSSVQAKQLIDMLSTEKNDDMLKNGKYVEFIQNIATAQAHIAMFHENYMHLFHCMQEEWMRTAILGRALENGIPGRMFLMLLGRS